MIITLMMTGSGMMMTMKIIITNFQVFIHEQGLSQD